MKAESHMATETETLRVDSLIPAHELEELERITGQKPSKWIRQNMGEIIAFARGEQLRQDASSILRSTREIRSILHRTAATVAINQSTIKKQHEWFQRCNVKDESFYKWRTSNVYSCCWFSKRAALAIQSATIKYCAQSAVTPEVVDLLKRINSALYPAEDGDLWLALKQVGGVDGSSYYINSAGMDDYYLSDDPKNKRNLLNMVRSIRPAP